MPIIPPTVLFDVCDTVATLTLNRPEAGNAVNLDLARGLLDAARRCAADDLIKCVVLTGTGRLFCAGGDLGSLAAAEERRSELLSELTQSLHDAMATLAKMRKPLLVLVNGPAAGAGVGLAVMGDIVFAANSAHFTAAYTAVGLTPDGGMTWQLPRLIGLRKTQEMIFTNERISATDAASIGLITRAIDDQELAMQGAAMAKKLAQSATAALGTVRALLLDGFQVGYESQMHRESVLMAEAGRGAESREGIAAFLAKRKPNFSGN